MKRLILVLLTSLIGSCNSTGVGNPGFDTQALALTSDSEVEPDATDNEQLDATALTHVLLVFGEIRFRACGSRDEDVVVEGPFVVDLIKNRVKPEIPHIQVPPSGLCGFDATLAPAQQPEELADRSLLFSGVRDDGTTFLLLANMTGTLRVRPLPDRTWTAEGHTWIWALRPRRWLLPSELKSEVIDETDNGDRIILIDINRHPLAYEAIRRRLAGRSSLYVDENDNLQLDPDEQSDETLIGSGLEDIE